MKQLFAIIIILVLIAGGAYWYTQMQGTSAPNPTSAQDQAQATTTAEVPTVKAQESIGKSVKGANIDAYNFGTGEKKILFVGGIHGGYEWNTVLLANQLMDYLKANPSEVPADVTVTVIPVLNPDGLSKVLASTTPMNAFTAADVNKSQTVQVSGRYNGNTVDLNRNFDCDWQAKGVWQSKRVSGGTAAFSEPESQAVQRYIVANKPTAVVVWYSSAGGVYASNCHDGVLPETKTIMDLFAKASGYKANESWDFYATTGDMVNWLAKEKIPAFSVLLTNHTDSEWDKNLAGVKAIFQHYASAQ
jgi:hypothetical protein